MVTDQNAFEIPGEPTLRRSQVPPIVVDLPLTLKIRHSWYVATGAFYTLVSICLTITALSLFWPPTDLNLASRLVMLGIQVFCFSQLPYWFFAAWRTMRDASLNDARLIINSNGLTDSRACFAAKWHDIVSARPANGRANEWGVSMVLRDATMLPKSRWLRGFGWLPREPNEIHIQTLGMTESSYIARNAIFHLVERAGGTILPQRIPGWFRL